MSQQQFHPDDDIVTRAVAAARQLPIQEGPSLAILSQTQQALLAAADSKPNVFQRIWNMPLKSKIAALLSLAASVAAVYVILSATSSRSIVWAQVIDKIVSAKTFSCVFALTTPGDNGLSEKGQLVFDNANNACFNAHVKYGGQEDDCTLVLNVKSGKSVVLVKGQKIAVTDLLKIGDENILKQNLFERLVALRKESVRSLGKKQIDGVECEGFEFTRIVPARFWANAQTGDPVRLEIDDYPLPEPVGHGNIVVNDFKIDGPIDPSQFDTEPPEGYTVLKSPVTFDLTGKPANDLVEYLRLYAKASGGRFPDRLIDPADPIYKQLNTMGAADEKITVQSTLRGLVQGGALPRLRWYMAERKEGTDYQYYPGISLGEKDRVVFWSRNTKTGEYTAAFGDLRVEKIDKDKVPPAGKDAEK